MHAARTAFAAALLASTFVTGCDALESDGIGPEGGIVVSEDGRMALEVPAGALEETVDISIEMVPGPQGSAADLYVIEPMGLAFSFPAELIYDYDDDMLGQAAPDSLSLVTQREASWNYLADQLVDDEDQTVSASLMTLSNVTVVIE
ncbi:MAG: hypothetical protein AAF799_16710 [Myxococcota bacterium]